MRTNFRRTSMRQANENFGAFDLREGRGGNLTPLQRRYAYWWDTARSYQVGRREMTSAVFGFKGRKVNGKVVPLSPETRIRTIDSLLLLSIVPIAKSLFLSEKQQGKYRLHFSEQVGYVTDGQIHFGGRFVGQKRVDPSQHRQAALDKRPLQDHQIYAQVDHNPNGLGDQMVAATGGESVTGHLKAPLYGNFAVIRDDLFIRLTIEGFDVYRFQKEDAALVEIVAQPGEVTAGQVLANLTGKVSYLAAEPWASKPDSKACKPVMDSIEGDSLSATHYVPQLSFAVSALELMYQRDEGELDHRYSASAEECWPIPLVQIPSEMFKARRQLEWEPNAAFKAALLFAVSPDAVGTDSQFCVPSPVTGRIKEVVKHFGYKVAHFVDEAGVESTMPLPGCADVRTEGEVRKGESIGDYVPRCYFQSYEQLTDVADGCIVKLEDAYLESLVIRSGETNWKGDGVLLDERFAGVLREHAHERLVDTGPMLPYVDEAFGIAVLPPVGFDVRKHGFQRQVNGVQYDTTPLGAMFSKLDTNAAPEVSAPKRRRRRNRNRSAKRQTEA